MDLCSPTWSKCLGAAIIGSFEDYWAVSYLDCLACGRMVIYSARGLLYCTSAAKLGVLD